MDWLELVKQLSIIIAMCVAIYGIDSWRREHVGKRQIELAEDSLALFYEAIDAIKQIRHPASYGHETEDIEKAKRESDKQYEARKSASVVFYRYNQYQELFSKIHASRYRFMAQIGKEESEAFNELRLVTHTIISSARALSRLWARSDFSTDEQWAKHQSQVDKYEAIFWDGLEDEDKINIQLNKIVSDIENVCKAVIDGKGTLHGALNIKIDKRS
jgi:hypothetical protein